MKPEPGPGSISSLVVGGTARGSVGDSHLVRGEGRDSVAGGGGADGLLWLEASTLETQTPESSTLPKRPLCPADNAPISSEILIRPEVSTNFAEARPDLAEIYNRVKRAGVPNYRGARVKLNNALNIDKWREWAHIYDDPSLADMLEYGFPSGYAGLKIPATNLTNHASSLRNPEQVKGYLGKECRLQAMAGPFPVPPFESWHRNNPVMTRPKRNSSELRVILDLSFPSDESVNSSIPRDNLDNAPFKLRLPCPLDLAERIRDKGRGCLLYKVDLSRAYRQLRGDPLDWPLLGVAWQQDHYVDLAIPFGLRHGASACQRTSEAAAAVSADIYDTDTLTYVDDTGGAALELEAFEHYRGLLATLDMLGLQTAPEKCQPPATQMLWIGVWYDTIRMLMSIDRDRVQEALKACGDFLSATRITLHAMQRLMGKVFHATKCTVAARAFLGRMLDLLREATGKQIVDITAEARADVAWLLAFLVHFNGLTLIKPAEPQFEASVDSCLGGGGGWCEGLGFYSVEYPEYIQQCKFSIASLECYNLLVAVRLWVKEWRGCKVRLFCDNWATVCATGSNRAQDPLIRSTLRELWWLSATWDVDIVVTHLPGEKMVIADLLSRAHLSESHRAKFESFRETSPESQRHIPSLLISPPLPL